MCSHSLSAFSFLWRLSESEVKVPLTGEVVGNKIVIQHLFFGTIFNIKAASISCHQLMPTDQTLI